MMITSCISSKRVTYFQSGAKKNEKVVDIPSYRLESVVRFKPDDILAITVNVPEEPSVAAMFNLPMVPQATPENSTEDFVSTGSGRQTFLINKQGEIDYPVLGKIKVTGLNQDELENHLKDRLREYVKVPTVVTVRLMNFKILVTGEVNSPGFKAVEKDQINLLEALALAGDMTIYGKRDDILLKRQLPNGSYRHVKLDINKLNIIESPYFFLQQNDAIYVKPIKAKSQTADISPMLNVVTGVISFSLSLVTFILMITKK